MVKVSVYLIDGRVSSYKVSSFEKAREHAHRIVNYGWRNVEGEVMVYYPTWQILKVTWPVDDGADLLAKKYEGAGETETD